MSQENEQKPEQSPEGGYDASSIQVLEGHGFSTENIELMGDVYQLTSVDLGMALCGPLPQFLRANIRVSMKSIVHRLNNKV